ncbi:ATPase, T2SS/T4P/T4SS family [Novosphingobium sp. MMS21-SN21R]|uniref:GspE/PulE family protein n=1 Tax=Novosphingobium sp. MMS21-SN21R TaxID=2969298 RepID=UPI002887A941|nr:ATPase, T2SS/T4P/T4SS family [Novosphingobium sp. MMS21-SN21R]MDT0508411.1 ATPase, T2SS/T4P/T4SS family [Novosphingobium sp. MMS21-SN21R]
MNDRNLSPADELLEVLTRNVGLSAEALNRARLVERESGERLDSIITRLGLASEEVLAAAIAKSSALPLLDRARMPAKAIDGPPLSAAFLHDVRAVPVSRSGQSPNARVLIAVSNPFERFAAEAMAFAFGCPVDLAVARASDIEAVIERLYATDSDVPVGDVIDDDDLERLKDVVSDAPVIRAVNRLIAQAVDAQASDIHIEPAEDVLAVRLRVDGQLRHLPPLPAAMRSSFVSRIKVMASLDIAERRKPQDGRMRVAVRGHEIDLRVATAPSIHGESVVMRILDRSSLALDFATLGFGAEIVGSFRRAVSHPHGIVLVTGPTGSGKTTTLYAALSELNAPDRKLLTVEDPIEYRLPGVIQSQVNPAIDYTFSAALRSFLRQDPDVIMVGEIRDPETALIAVQAALTGHLILSTLHTNTAAGAVSRLVDMGVEPFLLSSVLRGVLAQRLVRRLCGRCKLPYDASAALAEIAHGARIPDASSYCRPVGCDVCGGTGYAGRVAVLEFLPVDDVVGRLILSGSDTRTISDAARAGGMTSLFEDGLAKAAQGLTTIEEVLRAAQAE